MKNFILKSVTFSIILSLSLLWTYFVIQARNSSSSWLTVDSSSPASLYVGNNETLTAAKRNRLVKNAVREEVPTSDTALFDTGCDRKWQADNTDDDIYYAVDVRANGDKIYFYVDVGYYYLNDGSKWTTKYNWWGTRTTLHIRKKCN